MLLALNLVLLRPAFRPLDELAETMRGHDPLSPGTRVRVDGGPAVAALAQTFNEMLDRLESERRDSARRALLVQEAERQRIARELHDEVGQTLTGVMLQVEGLAAMIPDELRDQLDELRETARHGTEEVRRIARRLRPDALEELGLQSALAALAARIRASRRDSRFERRLEPAVPLSHEQELVVYRVAQEALTNVARHADATAVELPTSSADEDVVLTVRDDGARDATGRVRSSQGIRGMRERAMLIGALSPSTSRAGRRHRGRAVHPSRTENRMTTPLKTNILIADDHPIVLHGLRTVLDAQPDLEVVAEATDGEEAVERALSEDDPPGDPRHLDAAQDRTAGRARDHAAQARGARADALDARQRAVPVRGDPRRRLRLRAQELGRPRPRRGLPRDDARRAVPVSRAAYGR